MGLKSTASVQYHLEALNRNGNINMEGNKKRAITLPAGSRGKQIPIVGVVTAGLPILAIENIEGYIPWDGPDNCFALRVRGESMIGAGILDGDKVAFGEEMAKSGLCRKIPILTQLTVHMPQLLAR